jgi:5,10-methenyltetrahydromethanopterin hydrogenase
MATSTCADSWECGAFYEIPRTRAAAPLLRAGEPFQYRRKASLAMHALSEYIGAERVNDVQARKVVVDESGNETEVSMDDWVEVGVFAAADAGEPYLQKHRIRSGKQSITVTVPRNPTGAGIDPEQLLIDLKTDDNIKTVMAKS